MRTTAVLVSMLALGGCYTVRFYDGDIKDAGGERGRAYDLWVHSFFWGMVPGGKVDTSMCDDGVLKSKSQIGGLGLLAYALTVGIWTPMHVHLVCADPKGPDFFEKRD